MFAGCWDTIYSIPSVPLRTRATSEKRWRIRIVALNPGKTWVFRTGIAFTKSSIALEALRTGSTNGTVVCIPVLKFMC